MEAGDSAAEGSVVVDFVEEDLVVEVMEEVTEVVVRMEEPPLAGQAQGEP